MESQDNKIIVSRTRLTPFGASFNTHELTQEGPYLLRYVPLKMAKFFYSVVLGLGWTCFCAGSGAFLFMDWQAIYMVVTGALFIYLGNYYKTHTYADREVNSKRRTVRVEQVRLFKETETMIVDFDEVLALQLLKKKVQSDDGPYTAYELNVVRRNGDRHHILAHSDGEQLRKDMKVMAQMIGCEIRDERVPNYE